MESPNDPATIRPGEITKNSSAFGIPMANLYPDPNANTHPVANPNNAKDIQNNLFTLTPVHWQ